MSFACFGIKIDEFGVFRVDNVPLSTRRGSVLKIGLSFASFTEPYLLQLQIVFLFRLFMSSKISKSM